VLGRETGTGRWLLWTHVWIHPIGLERRKEEAARYKDFEKAGDLTIAQRMGADVEDVADIVDIVEKSELMDNVGVDQAGIGAIVDAITDRNIQHERIIGIKQGWHLVSAIKTLERKCAAGEVIHTGSKMMAWCVSNARIELKGNAVLITKQISGTGKIDPLMATLNAVALMALNPKPRKKQFQMLFV
jgi:phage terminase large subunit-like protein